MASSLESTRSVAGADGGPLTWGANVRAAGTVSLRDSSRSLTARVPEGLGVGWGPEGEEEDKQSHLLRAALPGPCSEAVLKLLRRALSHITPAAQSLCTRSWPQTNCAA